MVNDNERIIADKYSKQGWKAIRGGWPDFCFVKTNEEGKIIEWFVCEVKTRHDNLSWEQSVMRGLLERIGIKYKLEVV